MSYEEQDVDNELKIAEMQERLAEAGVDTVSQLSVLYGKDILFDTVPGTVTYAIDNRFSAMLKDGRQPWGLISDLFEAADGSLVYITPEGT